SRSRGIPLPNPKSKTCPEPSRRIENPKLLSPLLQHFFHKLADRRLIHPLGAVDEHDPAIVAFRAAVAVRHFVFRNVDAHGIRSVVALRKYSLERDLSFARKQPVERDFGCPRMRRLVDQRHAAGAAGDKSPLLELLRLEPADR